MSRNTIRSLDTLLKDGHISVEDLPELEKVVNSLALAIPTKAYELIDKADQNDPIKKQFVPSVQELHIAKHESVDPIGDSVHHATKGVIHRYPDRCLFLPVQVCPLYCRFCFRRESVGSKESTLTQAEREVAFNYIESHQEIWEVIITGGDPLILKPAQLLTIIQRLNAISHVDVIRIHTRIPVLEPHRITDEMLAALSSTKALYIAVHANHAKEFSKEAECALAKLSRNGIPLISQTTLLKGVNDNIDAMSQLMRMFVKNRIKPYYLHHGDLAQGTSHFRTSIEEGQALMRALRGRFSGLCQPTYMLDIPGGFGKVPIGPSYISMNQDTCHCVVEDHNGQRHDYALL